MKHTKDKTKTPFHLIPLEFVAYMARVMEEGTKAHPDRKAFDWQFLDMYDPDTYFHYVDAILRHLQKAHDNRLTKEGAYHLAAVACNAMILWYHSKNPTKGNEND